ALHERIGVTPIGAERHEAGLAAEAARARLDPEALAAAAAAGPRLGAERPAGPAALPRPWPPRGPPDGPWPPRIPWRRWLPVPDPGQTIETMARTRTTRAAGPAAGDAAGAGDAVAVGRATPCDT